MISVQCPSCKMVHSLPESALGKNARCNDCQHVFVVTHDAGLVELGVGQGVVSPAPQKIQLHPQVHSRSPQTGGLEVLSDERSRSKANKVLHIGVPAGLFLVAGIVVAVYVLLPGHPKPTSTASTEIAPPGNVRNTLRPSLSKARELANREIDAARLSGIAYACMIYASRNNDQMPAHLFAITSDLHSPQDFKSKFSLTLEPTAMTSTPADLESWCDWIYIGADLSTTTSSAERIVFAYSKDLYADHSRCIVFADCHSEWIEASNLTGVFNKSNNARAAVGLSPVSLDGPPPKSVPPHRISSKRPPATTPPAEFHKIAGLQTVARFLEPPMQCACPCWSPDGKYIMFIARPAEQAGGNLSKGPWNPGIVPGNIWVVSVDGAKRWLVSNFFFGKLLTPDGRRADPLKLDVSTVSWSLDGGKIAFRAYEGEDRPIGIQTDLYVMKADASDVFRVAKDDGWGKLGNRTLQWTPDGKGLLLGGSTIDLEGTKLSPLTVSGGGKVTNACSSRDGTKLAAIVEERTESGLGVIDRSLQQVKWLARGKMFGGGGTNYAPRSWSPDGKQIAADATNNVGRDKHIAIFDALSGSERRLVDGAAPSWSPDGQRIVFAGGEGDPDNLYLISPNGKNLQRITNLTPPGVQMIWGSYPCWSPDGKQIVFRRGQYIWVANLDGTRQSPIAISTDHSRVTNTGTRVGPCEWTPLWKPDGGIAFTPYKEAKWESLGATPEFEVSVTNVDGTEVRPLVRLQSPADGDGASWSPDGSKMAFDKNGNIWVAKGDGTGQSRLTGGRHPQWSPDSQKILYVQGSKGNEVLCTIGFDGSNQTQITEPSHGYTDYHCWCPDGKKIAFNGQYGIWIVSAQGGDAHRIAPGVYQPRWSPDGKKLAFFVQGKPVELPAAVSPSTVYVMNVDGSGIRPVIQVDKTAYGDNVVNNLSWSPDGKHILVGETAKGGYDYEDRHHIWIVDVSEPVFYQASYVSSPLLAWKVPAFDPVPRVISTIPSTGGAPVPGAGELPRDVNSRHPPAKPDRADGQSKIGPVMSRTGKITVDWTIPEWANATGLPVDNPIQKVCVVRKERRFPNLLMFAGVGVGGAAESKDDQAYKDYLQRMTDTFNNGIPPGKASKPVEATVNGVQYDKLSAESGIETAVVLVGVQDGVCVSYWFVGNPNRIAEFNAMVGKAKITKEQSEK